MNGPSVATAPLVLATDPVEAALARYVAREESSDPSRTVQLAEERTFRAGYAAARIVEQNAFRAGYKSALAATDRSALRIRIVDLSDDAEPPHECTLGEFVTVNEFDAEELHAIVSALETIGAFKMGGGAAPLVRVEVVS